MYDDNRVELTTAEYNEIMDDLYYLRFVDEGRHEGKFVRVPVLGRLYCAGDEERAFELKQQTKAYLFARKYYRLYGPSWAPRLPATDAGIEQLEQDEDVAWNLWGCFAASLRDVAWNLKVHPSFSVYASGVMAYVHTPLMIRGNKQLRAAFLPRPLAGIDMELRWRRPEEIARSWAQHAKMEQLAREQGMPEDELRRIVDEDSYRLAAISR
jgi:hypothetical protein